MRFKGTVDELILPYECNVIIDGKRFENNHHSLTGSINFNKAKLMEIEIKGRRASTRESISEMHIEKLKEIVSTYLSLTSI